MEYTNISPNRNSPRNHKIDTITIHCAVGQISAESLCNWFKLNTTRASSNYVIGFDGKIGLSVPEEDRSWCSSNAANDNRAVTIECASDRSEPYAINSKVYDSLINLLVDICKRNDIPELRWRGDKNLVGKVDKQNMTVHRWFANKSCPGDYIYDRLTQIAEEVNARLNQPVKTPATTPVYPDVPFKVRVTPPVVPTVWSGPTVSSTPTTVKMPPSIYTIVEVRDGLGSDVGWGKLKSGAGWVKLSDVTTIG